MALNIKNPEADRLARELAARTGETITQAVIASLSERLARERAKSPVRIRDQIMTISRRCAALPNRTNRMADEIIGYDEHGLPS